MDIVKANNKLTEIAEYLENIFEVDVSGAMLEIITQFGVYVINYHGVAKQIWLASPKSGPWHFTYQEDNWYDTRTQQSIDSVLKKELLQES